MLKATCAITKALRSRRRSAGPCVSAFNAVTTSAFDP
jgi:hypothetical protein